MAKVYRTLQLKVIERRQIAGERDVLLPIQELLKAIRDKAKTLSDRHVPAAADIKEGKRCSFIDHIAPSSGNGVTFRFGTYIKGDMPLGMDPKLDDEAASLEASQLTDCKTGSRREPILSFNALACGQVLIVESVKGAGGMRAMEDCLTALLRRHVDANYARLHLLDVGTREISAAIDRAGGVREIVMDAVQSHEKPTHRFGPLLKDARGKIGGTDVVRIGFKAKDDGVLSKDDVLKAYEDLEADEVDRVVLLLRDGTKFIGTEKSKVRKVIAFEDAATEDGVLKKMAEYLLELQQVNDKVSVLTSDGMIG